MYRSRLIFVEKSFKTTPGSEQTAKVLERILCIGFDIFLHHVFNEGAKLLKKWNKIFSDFDIAMFINFNI